MRPLATDAPGKVATVLPAASPARREVAAEVAAVPLPYAPLPGGPAPTGGAGPTGFRLMAAEKGRATAAPSASTYHDVGMHRGKRDAEAIDDLVVMLREGKIWGKTAKGGQVSANASPTNALESAFVLRIHAGPEALTTPAGRPIVRDANAPAGARWYGTFDGQPIDLGRHSISVIANGDDLAGMAARVATLKAALAEAGLGHVQVESIDRFARARFAELAEESRSAPAKALLRAIAKPSDTDDELTVRKLVVDRLGHASEATRSQVLEAAPTIGRRLLATARPELGGNALAALEKALSGLSPAEAILVALFAHARPDLARLAVLDAAETDDPKAGLLAEAATS